MNKFKKKITPVHLIRRITQIVAFLLIPGLFTSTFYAIKEIYSSIIKGSFNLTDLSSQIWLLIAIIPITIVMGRFFCSFFCAFGSMGDLFWFISKKTIKSKFRIGEKADFILKFLKYGILIFLIIVIWSLNLMTLEATSNPWTIFGIFISIADGSSFKYLLSIGGLLLLLVIIGSLFVERCFCRYFCPLGAIFALASRLRLFNIKKNHEKCGSCKICTNKCIMGIPLYHYDKVTSGECINCFACIENCPRNNVKVNPTPVVASAVSIATISGLFYMGNMVSAAELDNKSISKSPISIDASVGKYTDGTYTGSAFGFCGDTEVSVTVENGNISDITILSYEDDEEYLVRAMNSVIPAILESQEVNVNTVSGATFSSNGILEAVAEALNLAADMDESLDTSTDIPTDSNTSVDQVYQDIPTDSNTSVDQVYQDGTYTGTGSGFRGNTEVSVMVSDGKITDIAVTSYEDDYEFFVRAQDTVIMEIIEIQDVDVDAVSGATFSSNGLMEAVADAIGVEYTNTNNNTNADRHGGFGRKR